MKRFTFLILAVHLAASFAQAKDVYAEVGHAMATKLHVPYNRVGGISKVYNKLLSNGRYYQVADYYVEMMNHKCFKVTYCLGGEHEIGFVVSEYPTACYENN